MNNNFLIKWMSDGYKIYLDCIKGENYYHMTVNVKRSILAHKDFKSAIEKIYSQDIKLQYRVALRKFVKQYAPELKEILEMIEKYKNNEEGKKQLIEYLNESVEMPSFPNSLLEDESIKISAQDTAFLENVVQ